MGFVGVLADLAVWASARGLVFLTDLKQCREWLGFVFLFLICDTGVLSSPFRIICDNVSLCQCIYFLLLLLLPLKYFFGVEVSGLLLNLLLLFICRRKKKRLRCLTLDLDVLLFFLTNIPRVNSDL